MPILNASTPAAAVEKLTVGLARSICNTAQTYCKGPNQQYDSADECFNYLSQKVRFGQAYELGTLTRIEVSRSESQGKHANSLIVGRDTLLCRSVHQNMVQFRPEVHCPHIGKTGGGYCADDTTYLDTVTQNYFTNSPYTPYGYKGRD